MLDGYFHGIGRPGAPTHAPSMGNERAGQKPAGLSASSGPHRSEAEGSKRLEAVAAAAATAAESRRNPCREADVGNRRCIRGPQVGTKVSEVTLEGPSVFRRRDIFPVGQGRTFCKYSG